MTDYVIDTSIVIDYLIESDHTPYVRAFFEQIEESDRIAIPEFCLLECTNVIWKHVRFGAVSREDSGYLVQALYKLRLWRTPMKQLLDRALEIGLNNGLAVYDSAYIAIAMNYGYPLLTLDVK